MKKTLHKLLTGILVSLTVCFLASCQDLSGPQGEPGADGRDAIVRDTAYAVDAALAEKTGGGDDPWTIRVSGVDISDPDAFRHLFNGIVAGIEEGDIALDLSGCTGKTFAHTNGINGADKLRLVSVTLPASLTHIVDGRAGYGAFHGYTRLGSVSAPGLTYIGDYAFYTAAADGDIGGDNEALTEVDFPEVRSVGAYAFYHYPNLNSISLPRAVSIGDYAFRGDALSSLAAVDLPSARSIGSYAFDAWRSIASINLPEVITIGNNAFSAPAATMPNTALTALSLPKCETIGNNAFLNYQGLVTVELPELRTIGSSAFYAPQQNPNTTLTTLTLPNVETIGDNGFRNCTAIGSISLPRVTSIGAYAFAAISASPNTVLSILELTTVTSIGNRAFEYCAALESLKLGPTVPILPTTSTTAANGIFLQTGTGTIDIKVPTAQQGDYDAAGWKAIAQGNNATSGTIRFGTNHKEITVTPY
jgi:hypothetical protein